jgi:hypothetical protein
MSDDPRYQLRKNGVTWRSLDDQIVVLDLESSRYLSVSGAAIEIWPQLLQGGTVEEFVRTLVDAFDIDDATARADTMTFLEDLRGRQLLR